MTREEARKELRIIAVELTGKLGATTDEQEAHVLSKQINAIDAALDALWPVSREQVRATWIATSDNGCPMYACSACGARDVKELYEHNNPRLFCYHCGRPMTDEAAQLFLKRIEALRGGEDMP